MRILFAFMLALTLSLSVNADEPLSRVCEKVNAKLVKLFGASGIRGIANYGTGILISSDGHILTAATPMLNAAEITVHTADGAKYVAVVLAIEPFLDSAILKIKLPGKRLDEPTGLNLDHYDYSTAVAQPLAKPGDWVFGFSNQFEVAMRDEPMTVQKGVIAAYTKMSGRRGIFEFPYTGSVYIVDQITNNPGAAGGALVDRNGRLLGIIGKEIKNTLSESWMNYSIPLNAETDVIDGDKTIRLSLKEFVALGMKGQYKSVKKSEPSTLSGAYHGMIFIPNVVERTPPYLEDVIPNSPAAKAGLRPDDLVSFIDGEPMNNILAVQNYFKRTTPGQKVRIEIRRGDRLQPVELELAELPPTSRARKGESKK